MEECESPGGGDGAPTTPTTPSRRNKRKMTEPKRRTDFSIKRLCPESPGTLHEYDGSREFPPDTPEPSTSSGTCTPSPGAGGEDESPQEDDTSRTKEDTNRPRSDALMSAPACKSGKTRSKGRGSQGKARPASRSSISGESPPVPPSPGPTPIIPPGISMFPAGLHVDSTGGIRYLVAPPACTTPLPPGAAPHAVLCAGSGSGSGADTGPDSGSLSPGSPPAVVAGPMHHQGRRSRKNYKNMTRERRVEANARERSRVHTISAAFDSLRQAVPSYSYNQKLSKLAILRIACNYIVALARLADMDYTRDQDNLSFAECVDLCTQTIQTEGRARRRH